MATQLTLRAGTKPVEGGANGSFVIDLSAAATSDLTVNFNPTGTATLGTDYSFSLTVGSTTTAITGNSFVLPTGTTTATLNVIAKADSVTDPNETVTVNLMAGTGYDLAGMNTLFAPKVDFTVGVGSRSVSVGDFNHDGKLDLATVNWSSETLSVLYRNDDNIENKFPNNAGFANEVHFTTGAKPYSVSAGDFNNDSWLDLAVANKHSNSISVFMGSSKGFSTSSEYATNYSPYSVTSGDFNQDGFLDMVTTNSSGGISVLLNKGGNGFTKYDYAITGSVYPYSVTVADLNDCFVNKLTFFR